VVMVNDDLWHERLSPDQVTQFVNDLRTKGSAAVSGCHLHVEKGRAG
jgi:hypothetical protein